MPELPDLIDVKGGIVTTDAMSCRKEIAKKVREKKADYVLALKENQPALFEDVKLWFGNETPSQSVTTRDKGHGRIETREYFLETDIGRLPQKPNWAGLEAIGAARSTVVENGEKRVYTRYFITSLTDINEFAHAVRRHWAIENQLHWRLDVTFGEDASRARKDNAPLNLNVLRKVALALLRPMEWGRIGLKKKMFIAALNPAKMLDILFGVK